MHHTGQASSATCRLTHFIFVIQPVLRHFHWKWVSYLCQQCVTKMLYCDWSVIGRFMWRTSLTRSHHATAVGPIQFFNRSNNCRIGKINGRRSSLARSHHAIFVFSSSLRPTKDENRMVCARLYALHLYLFVIYANYWVLILQTFHNIEF